MDWESALWPEWSLAEEIGAGSFGRVYKIRRRDVGGEYLAALKVITIPDPQAILRMRGAGMSDAGISAYSQRTIQNISKEIALMERLKGHSHIVSYEDHRIVRRTDGPGFHILLRMELLTGLDRYLDLQRCDERTAVRIGMDLCDALVYLEKEKVVHRDIKVSNIFATSHGDFKLGDFGIAGSYEGAEAGVWSGGTKAYIAPESYFRKTADRRSDIYSLGMVLYRLMNRGEAPFSESGAGRTGMSGMSGMTGGPGSMPSGSDRRLSGEPLPVPATASVDFARIILKACSYEADARYACAADMLEDLRKLEAGRDRRSREEKVQEEKSREETVRRKFFAKAGDL
ncbi:MAG: serine/threonine protein kinase [Lachnospiraceae bacterium]|nr:serine/threonine protein kinase [Lachnospiraceae bacterium]